VAGKSNGSGLFAALTYDEMEILRASLDSSSAKLTKGTRDDATAAEINDLWWDVADDRRDRWNTEHPDLQYQSHRVAVSADDDPGEPDRCKACGYFIDDCACALDPDS
jgi:hypothetical protein